MLKKPCLKFPKSATFHTPHPFETYFSENSSDLAQPFFPYLRHLSNLQVYDSGSRGRIVILYYSYDITDCGRVYKTGTLHLIHDDSQKNLENNKTLAKLCMYYCDHKIIFNLSLFPKIFSSQSLSSSFCHRSSWFQMTRWVRLLFGIEKTVKLRVLWHIEKLWLILNIFQDCRWIRKPGGALECWCDGPSPAALVSDRAVAPVSYDMLNLLCVPNWDGHRIGEIWTFF